MHRPRLNHMLFVACGMAALLLAACTVLPTTGTQTLPGGKLAYALAGSGQPTLVLQSGLGDDRSAWASVAPQLAAHYTVFAYDRPGYGESSASNGPRDACSIAAELHALHALLADAGVKPPYLLLGHSIGGLYQYAFARLYPDEVAGLVLLDPTHPAHWQRMQNEVPATAALLSGMRATVFIPAMRREFDDQSLCQDRLAALPPLHKPARVLTRTRYGLVERGGFEALVHTLEPDWLALSGAVRIEPVADSGHYIQQDQPARVIAAIREVAAEVAAR